MCHRVHHVVAATLAACLVLRKTRTHVQRMSKSHFCIEDAILMSCFQVFLMTIDNFLQRDTTENKTAESETQKKTGTQSPRPSITEDLIHRRYVPRCSIASATQPPRVLAGRMAPPGLGPWREHSEVGQSQRPTSAPRTTKRALPPSPAKLRECAFLPS